MSNTIKSSDIKLVTPADKPISNFLSDRGTQKYLDTVLKDKKNQFVTNLVSIVNQNPAIQECTNLSIMSGAIVATTLNLSLNKSFGYAYLVPFNNNKLNVKEAQFQIGYKGYIQLAMRSGQYRRLNAVPVYENQFISWSDVDEELNLHQTEGAGDVVGYVAFFELLNGFKKTMYWSYEKMLNHADEYSMAFNRTTYKEIQVGNVAKSDMWKYSSFWYKSFDDMGLKTMLRQILSKYGMLSEEMEKAHIFDQAVVNEGEPVYIDNPDDRTDNERANQDKVEAQQDPFAEKIDNDSEIPMGDF